MIDLHKLRIFDVVAEAGSFSAAAERLYITQSAVSQQIKDLENSLGHQLFQRGRRGVRLTQHGEELASYSRQIFQLLRQAEQALTNVDKLESGRLLLGATPGVSIYLAPDWVQRFRKRYPRLTVNLSTGITSQIAADVLAGRLDLGVIEGEMEETPRLLAYPLDEIEQRVVVGNQHPFWGRDEIALDELKGQSFIMRQPSSQSRIWLEQALQDHGITPMIGAEFDNLESIKRMVSQGNCLTILPPYVLQQEVGQGLLRALPILGRPFTRTVRLILGEQSAMLPVVRAFLDELQGWYGPLPGRS